MITIYKLFIRSELKRTPKRNSKLFLKSKSWKTSHFLAKLGNSQNVTYNIERNFNKSSIVFSYFQTSRRKIYYYYYLKLVVN